MQTDFFSRAGIEEAYTFPNGEVLTLPVRYFDYAAITAVFPSSAARVRALLPDSRLKLVTLLPGTTVVALAAMEYRRWTVRADSAQNEPYNEVAIMFPVLRASAAGVPLLPLLMPERFASFGWYVHRLPVTTELARDGGILAWGFPKFQAEISFTESACARSCRLRTDGKEILTLEVEKLPTRPRRVDEYLYTVKDGDLLRTRFETRGEHGAATLRGGASYTLGDHPFADELRGLKMGHVALMREYSPRLQALLHAAPERRASMQVESRIAVPAGR
jgi:hypothetical protein